FGLWDLCAPATCPVCHVVTNWRTGGAVRERRRAPRCRPRREYYQAGKTAGENTAVEPPWKTLRVSQFPTAATAVDLRLHFKCLDGQSQGYILKWLDAAEPNQGGVQTPPKPS